MASSASIIVHEINKLEETTFLYQPLSKFGDTMWVDHVHTSTPISLATSRPCINSPSVVQMTSNLAQEAQSNICEMMLFAPCHANLFFFLENHAKKLKFRVPFVKLMHVYISTKIHFSIICKKGMFWCKLHGDQNTPWTNLKYTHYSQTRP